MSANRIDPISSEEINVSISDVSRRQFLRNAGIGAVATGIVAAGGVALFDAADAGATGLAQDASPATPKLEGSDIFAHIANARTGEMTIFVGEKAISITNQQLAQSLLQAAQ